MTRSKDVLLLAFERRELLIVSESYTTMDAPTWMGTAVSECTENRVRGPAGNIVPIERKEGTCGTQKSLGH